MSFTERVKQLRGMCKWSQIDLAKKLDVASGTIGGYENGSRTPNARIMAELAELFGVSVEYLAYGPELSRSQYAAFKSRLSDVLDHTSADDLEAMEIPERALRQALRSHATIREDRAVELASALHVSIADILAAAPEEPTESLLEDLTDDELAKVAEYIRFLKSQRR